MTSEYTAKRPGRHARARFVVPAALMLLGMPFASLGDAAQKSALPGKPRKPVKQAETRKTEIPAPSIAEREMKPAELSLPPVEEYELLNGMRVFYIRDELPQFSIVAIAGFGKLYEGRLNAGISDLLARALTLGGSKRYPGDRLHEAVERVGGRIAISASWETVNITIRVLERHADLALDIMADLLADPELDERSIADARAMMVEEIRRKKDSPSTLAIEKVREIIFDGVGYGSVPSEQSVNSISQAELRTAFNNHFRAGNMAVGAVGAIEAVAARGRIEKALSGVARGARVAYRFDAEKAAAAVRAGAKKIYFIERPVPQATIVIGTLAPPVADPDSHSLGVMNFILGEGSFNSRLVREIRVDRGLSYAVQSVLRQRKETGVFLAFAQTNTAQSPLTLRLILENMEKMATSPVTPDELVWARQSLINSYIFEFETPLDVLEKYMTVYHMGLPISYITDYQRNVAGVGADAVLKSGKKLFEQGSVRLVLGEGSLKKELAKFGEVVVVRP
ncbi:MAG TPA: pitrilysin family protein [Spirochaetota bacterium]|nr:pitrilysin family protein [Spirochaetota bacterium]